MVRCGGETIIDYTKADYICLAFYSFPHCMWECIPKLSSFQRSAWECILYPKRQKRSLAEHKSKR